MLETAYYVYALKDPRRTPAMPFYIGKGTGIRAWEHAIKADNTRKGQRIAEIQKQGKEVIVSKLADGLSDLQALKLEAELIAAFGTQANGGILTNSVQPSGTSGKAPKNVIVPLGAREKSQLGLQMLKEAVLELAQANAEGVTNSEVVKSLGLQSDYAGGSKDYLSWSLLGLLMREGRMARVDKKKHKALTR
ncbi:MAG: GIY-YIG nuclease family protein [Candidatus Sulfotelmatobacter sp.]